MKLKYAVIVVCIKAISFVSGQTTEDLTADFIKKINEEIQDFKMEVYDVDDTPVYVDYAKDFIAKLGESSEIEIYLAEGRAKDGPYNWYRGTRELGHIFIVDRILSFFFQEESNGVNRQLSSFPATEVSPGSKEGSLGQAAILWGPSSSFLLVHFVREIGSKLPPTVVLENLKC
jgi:hypothetical protein